MLRGKEATLAAIIKIIIKDEPETQDEIAQKLNISRRYVAKLLKPLMEKGVVMHPYVVNMDKLSELGIYQDIDEPLNNIIEMFEKMGNNVLFNLDKVVNALKTHNLEDAKCIIFQDYALNKMEEEIHLSIKMDSLKYLPMEQAMLLSLIASNIERCGDYISNIAEEITNGLTIKDYLTNNVDEIFDIIKEMFIIAMDMVKNKKMSFKIYELEENLHKKLDEIMKNISDKGCKSEDINYYIQFGMFLKDVERFGDRCIKIFEASREFYYGVPHDNTPEYVKNIKI
ncbi:PhoU domain-containing protein [Methanothermococcus okinawensis]|uniref:PhoU family protein n=1 Tax=Methanothermococcus okinawensis (strain DSM 14208 / JCM 11175 / IH1) TaxID=647113 RepID=F8AL79_METOI|nr:PhoU domain-containing protein [Methanothermococcus okinawensis]AEH06615.1 PhoU family protein [Methanothermococcus okinawensis IH1]